MSEMIDSIPIVMHEYLTVAAPTAALGSVENPFSRLSKMLDGIFAGVKLREYLPWLFTSNDQDGWAPGGGD